MSEHDEIRLDGLPPATPPPPTGPGLPVRWCLLLAVLAVLAAAAGGGLLSYRRAQVRQVTEVRYRQSAADLTGCPQGDNCVPLAGPGEVLTLPAGLAGAGLVTDSSLLDASSSRTIRTVQLYRRGPVAFEVIAQCVAGAGPVADSESTSATAFSVVRPGHRPGCSVAVQGQAPAGVPLPVAALRELAADPDLQLAE